MKQSHFNIDVPLELGDIFNESPGDASIREKITVAIVWDALRKTFPGILERKLKKRRSVLRTLLNGQPLNLFRFYPLIYASLSPLCLYS